MPRGHSINWTPEMDSLLGTVIDEEVAKQLGTSPQTVGRRRHTLGISALGASFTWTPEMEVLIGTMSDREVGERLGISGDAVKYHKYELGIPSWQLQSPRMTWTPEAEALLGTTPDRVVAELLGILRVTVAKRRYELNLPSWREQHRVIPVNMSAWSSEAGKIYAARQYHKKKGLLNTLTYEQWAFACDWFDHCCAYCGKGTFLTEDHLVPVSRGGPRTVLNIIPACWKCNYSKRARQAHLWIYEKFGMKEGKVAVERIVTYLRGVQRSG